MSETTLKPRYPKTVKSGSSSVKVYRSKQIRNKSGYLFRVAWTTPEGRKRESFANESTALNEARLKADQLNAGRIAGANMTLEDRDELSAARQLTGKVPLIAALEEWRRVRHLTDNNAIAAAEAWGRRNSTRFNEIKVSDAIDRFIASKEKSGAQGERTYRAKLKPLTTAFPERMLHSITSTEFTAYLETFSNNTTRNDIRKRTVTLCKWAQKNNHLPRGISSEIELTDRSKEMPPEIGIIDPMTFKKCLDYIKEFHVEYLAALVLAGFCGIRIDELHGKKADMSKRQGWEDISLTARTVSVTAVKTNTAAWRTVPLCDAAIKWLKLCSVRNGPICSEGAMHKVRLILKENVSDLPGNCLRHSFITYRVAAVKGNKPQVATEAGNSVKEIDKHYRRPKSKAEGLKWFSVSP